MLTIIATSDLHGALPPVPACDLLLIAGDLCGPSDVNRQERWLDGAFRSWLDTVPAKEVVVIAGNHDWIFEREPQRVPKLRWHYLQDESVELFGLKIYGSPWQPRFCDWAFNLDEPELDTKFALIPQGTDILLTHGPALGSGDLCIGGHRAGSTALLEHIGRVQPRLHVCGHIHEGYGEYKIGRTVSANVSFMDVRYEPVNKPMIWTW